MSQELAYVLIDPYTLSKSRTGGVIGRIIRQTGLELVAMRMFGPSRELAERYAAMIRTDLAVEEKPRNLLADYVLGAYTPDAKTGKPRRVLMLLFEGKDAVRKISEAAGSVRYNMDSARSVRDIYGDFVMDDHGQVKYFEPAILVGTTPAAVRNQIRLWAEFSERDGGFVDAADVVSAQSTQRTLVLIKPDNFMFPSGRPGNIIDIFSGSGLRIVAAKIHRMSVAEAEEFYGPVKDILRQKLKGRVAQITGAAVSKEFGFELPVEACTALGEMLGPIYGEHQFYEIVKFMTGHWVPDCAEEDKASLRKEKCLALVYDGPNAVQIIRDILGPTDPSKAAPGQVRREYGKDVMVNAAHASDSTENARREMGIIRVAEDTIRAYVDEYYPQK